MMTVAKIRMPEKGIFVCRVLEANRFKIGDQCIVELDYGKDIGEVLEVYELTPKELSQNKLPAFRVVRLVGPEDQKKLVENDREATRLGNEFKRMVAAQ